MKITTEFIKSSAADQKAGYEQPPKGTYHLVGTNLQFRHLPSGKVKLVVVNRILKPLDNGKEWAGKTLYIDLHWDLTKDGNAKKLGVMSAANRNDKPFDSEDRDALVKVLTGTPYQAKIDLVEEVGADGKLYKNQRERELKHLSREQCEAYTNDPDWKVPAPKERWLEDKHPDRNGRPYRKAVVADPAEDGGVDAAQDSDPFG